MGGCEMKGDDGGRRAVQTRSAADDSARAAQISRTVGSTSAACTFPCKGKGMPIQPSIPTAVQT